MGFYNCHWNVVFLSGHQTDRNHKICSDNQWGLTSADGYLPDLPHQHEVTYGQLQK